MAVMIPSGGSGNKEIMPYYKGVKIADISNAGTLPTHTPSWRVFDKNAPFMPLYSRCIIGNHMYKFDNNGVTDEGTVGTNTTSLIINAIAYSSIKDFGGRYIFYIRCLGTTPGQYTLGMTIVDTQTDVTSGEKAIVQKNPEPNAYYWYDNTFAVLWQTDKYIVGRANNMTASGRNLILIDKEEVVNEFIGSASQFHAYFGKYPDYTTEFAKINYPDEGHCGYMVSSDGSTVYTNTEIISLDSMKSALMAVDPTQFSGVQTRPDGVSYSVVPDSSLASVIVLGNENYCGTYRGIPQNVRYNNYGEYEALQFDVDYNNSIVHIYPPTSGMKIIRVPNVTSSGGQYWAIGKQATELTTEAVACSILNYKTQKYSVWIVDNKYEVAEEKPSQVFTQ